jgi:RNA polymerase sigma-70 factor (ECF subfamily)
VVADGRIRSATVTLDGRFPSTVDAARRGDPSAIEALYRDTAPLVLGYLRANRASDPDDLTADVFVSMITSIGGFEGDERQFRSWLLTITHRRLVDAQRRWGRRHEDPTDDDEFVGLSAAGSGVEAEAMSRLQADGILAAIDELTTDQRAALLLRVVGDLAVRDVAIVMGKPETAVKALLRRAVATVGRRLGPSYGDRAYVEN